jgi:CRISPR-associated endonuclease/helicase Cas3
MTPDGFAEFVRAVHGYKPFPWQERLLRRVLADGWPEVIATPTASGKTSVIDVAVFALASEAAAAATPRRQPRRIFYVIDRRVVVDQAYLHARKLASALASADDAASPVGQVARWLRALGGDSPLTVARMRGGMYRDQTWTRSPAQPVVCVATVDQLGSRLLFRGYGLPRGSRNMLPVHAGLVGNDALIVLDEAHLSRAFDDTLRAIARYRGWARQPLATPWAAVRMTATPTAPARSMLQLDERDEHDLELGRRMRASKPTVLAEVKCEAVKRGAPDAERMRIERDNVLCVAEDAARHARGLRVDHPRLRVVGVVLNRVAGARAAFEALRAEEDADAVLLTGRTRPFDRDRLLDWVLPRCAAGRERRGDERPLFVVATQCIEVGADIDFDALVTECAALDALRQRFGRLDRLGRHGAARAVVIARSDQVKATAEPDSVYGKALAATWQWLDEQAERDKGKRTAQILDMGVAALAARLQDADELASLFKPWDYADEGPSMRWDPADDRRYAFRADDPAKATIRTVRGANRLAIEALRLLPVVPVGSRLETTGFPASEPPRGRDAVARWPIWTCRLTRAVVASLLTHPSLASRSPDRESLRRLGINEVFRSRRITQGRYRNFVPAEAWLGASYG